MDEFFHAIRTVHMIVAVVLGIASAWVWLGSSRRFPRYVHVLALAALALGCLIFVVDPTLLTPANLPTAVLLMLAMPTLVYAAFIFCGAMHVAGPEDRDEASEEDGES